MKNKLLLAVIGLGLIGSITSCTNVEKENNNNYIHDLTSFQISNKASFLKRHKVYKNEEYYTSKFDIKILEVSRPLRIVTDPIAQVDYKIPTYRYVETEEEATNAYGDKIYNYTEDGTQLDVVKKTTGHFEVVTDAEGNEIYKRKSINNIAVDTFGAVRVKIQIDPKCARPLETFFRKDMEIGLTDHNNFQITLSNGRSLRPSFVHRGTIVSEYILDFKETGSENAHNLFFNTVNWGTELEASDVNKIIRIEFAKGDTMDYYSKNSQIDQYKYIDEARNNIVATAVQDYNVFLKTPVINPEENKK